MCQFSLIYNSYDPWLLSKFCFCSIACERISGMLSNFVYALTLTRSRLGLLHVNFRRFNNRFMVRYYRQNFVSTEYLENELME